MKLPTIYLEDDYSAMARRGGEIVADIVRRSSRLVVALPTGSTSVGLYADLARRHRERITGAGENDETLERMIAVGASAEHMQRQVDFGGCAGDEHVLSCDGVARRD